MALTKVSGDFIKAGSITQAHLHSSHGITTSHLTEGDKLFFTNARVDSRIGSLSTSDLSEGTNLYYTDARARAAISATGSLSYNSTTGVMSFTMPAQNTSNITEGSNLYYTDARADARIAAADTGDLSEGTNLYYTQARFNTAFTAKSTSDLSEGTNLYYTDARADARVALIVDSAPGTLNTLNELAAALGDDANFATTTANSIGTKWTQDNAKITNWDTAYGWGDHGVAGYLTSSSTQSKYLRSDATDTMSAAAGTSEFLTFSNTTSAGAVQIGFQQNDTDGLHHRAYFKAFKGTGAAAGAFDLIVRSSGGGITADVLSLRNGSNDATWRGHTIWNAGNLTNNSTNWNTAYGWGDHASAGYLTSLPSHTHDDRYYTESEIQQFFDRGYLSSHSATDLAAGWYTIATNTGDRALGEFQIWDTASSDHQSVLFSASHHFGTDSSNDITVLANSRYSGTNFRHIRIKEGGTYDGAALQVYIDGASNTVYVAIVGGNAQESGWVLKDWIADGTDPGDLDSYNSMTERTIVDLDDIVNGGIITTGPIYSGGQTTQYRVLNTSDEGSGNGLDADTLDGQHASAFLQSESDTLSTVTGRGASTNTAVTLTGGAKIVVQDGTNGGTSRGLFMWTNTDTNWGIYMSTPGSTNNIAGGTAPSGLNGETSHSIRFRIASNATNGFIWENNNNATLMSLKGSAGDLVTAASMRAPIFYDSADTNSYFDSGTLVLRSGDPTIYMRDTNHRSVALHNNSNRFYVLGAPVDSTTYTQISGVWPWYVQLDTNDVYTGSIGYAGASYRAPVFYDRDDTGYYVDPSAAGANISINTAGVVRGNYFVGSNYATDGYTVYKGYDNWNHFISVRGHCRPGQGKTQAAILGGHQTSFVEYAESNSTTGWFFIGSGQTNYIEVAKITRAFSSFMGSVRAPIFEDSNNTNYFYHGDSSASLAGQMNIWGGTGSTYGNQLILGQQSISAAYTLQDSNARPLIYMTGQYPALALNHTVTSNSAHGPTIQFTFDGSNGRQWMFGASGDGEHLDIGYSDTAQGNSNYNPHNGISGYSGTTFMSFKQNGNIGIGSAGDWGIYGNGDPGYAIDTRGTLYNNTDVRAPIFYDSNNTGYYIHADNTSNLNDLTVNNITANAHIYGRSVNASYSNVYRMGGYYFTWDSDNYGANIQHSIRSTYGDSYEDSITLNSYNHIRFNLDSNNNNGVSYFQVGDGTTGTGNVIMTLNQAAKMTLGRDGFNPQLTLEYDVHASGVRWDTVIDIGKIQDRRSGSSNYPTYISNNGFGISFQSNSDGVVYGMEEYSSGNYRPVIGWGDDDGDTPMRWLFNNGEIMSLSYNGNLTIKDVLYMSHGGFIQTVSGGVMRTSFNFYAERFYDYYNSTYYVDVDSSSYINSLHTAGTLQVGASGTSNIYMGGTSGNYFRFHTNNSHTYFDGNVGDIHWRQGVSTRFTFYMTSANMTINGSLTQNSDERVKENIVEIPNAINKVKALKGVYYNRTDFNTGVTKVGVLAQEVEAVLPELIVEAPDSGLKSVAYGELTAVLVNAIKEQQTIIDDLKSRLETLENN